MCPHPPTPSSCQAPACVHVRVPYCKVIPRNRKAERARERCRSWVLPALISAACSHCIKNGRVARIGFCLGFSARNAPRALGAQQPALAAHPLPPGRFWAAHCPVVQRDAAVAVGTGERGSSLPSVPLEWSCGPKLRPLELCRSGDTESSLDDLLEMAGTEHCPLVVQDGMLHPRAPPGLHGVVMGSQQRGCDGGAGMGPACLAQSL